VAIGTGKIISLEKEFLPDQQNSFTVFVSKITLLNGIIIHSLAWAREGVRMVKILR